MGLVGTWLGVEVFSSTKLWEEVGVKSAASMILVAPHSG